MRLLWRFEGGGIGEGKLQVGNALPDDTLEEGDYIFVFRFARKVDYTGATVDSTFWFRLRHPCGYCSGFACCWCGTGWGVELSFFPSLDEITFLG